MSDKKLPIIEGLCTPDNPCDTHRNMPLSWWRENFPRLVGPKPRTFLDEARRLHEQRKADQ